MSVRVMTEVWALDLPDSQKIVLLALADSANDEGFCWPSMASLARKCSKGERTVQGVIKQLVEAGHLTRKEVLGKGCQYIVHPRRDCAPQQPHPRKDCARPPQSLRDTPAAAADKPSKNHQEPSKDSASADAPLTPDEIVEDWNALAKACDLQTVVKLTEPRKRQVKARLREFPEIQHWQRAFAHIRGSPFLLGKNDRGWKADFDFMIQAKSFPKLVEGSYGQA